MRFEILDCRMNAGPVANKTRPNPNPNPNPNLNPDPNKTSGILAMSSAFKQKFGEREKERGWVGGD